jgi:hypothetical protein
MLWTGGAAFGQGLFYLSESILTDDDDGADGLILGFKNVVMWQI